MRDRSLDIMKGIGILLVVFAHVYHNSGLIYLFHMPLFFYTFGGCNDIFEVGIWFEEKSQDFIDTIFSVFSSLFCLLGIDRIKISSFTRRYNNLW